MVLDEYVRRIQLDPNSRPVNLLRGWGKSRSDDIHMGLQILLYSIDSQMSIYPTVHKYAERDERKEYKYCYQIETNGLFGTTALHVNKYI